MPKYQYHEGLKHREKTGEVQTAQECHPFWLRVHVEHQINPLQYVSLYLGITPVGRAICQVNTALYYRACIKEQVI